MKLKTLLLLIVATLTLAGCQTATDEIDEDAIETFIIESELKDCVGVGPMKCMVVNGKYFYDKIQGFEFESGYEYELKVKKSLAFGTDDPAMIPADASKFKYELVEVVSKNMVASDDMEAKASVPEGCKSWFDGCNNCMVGEDGTLACTRKFCAPEAMEDSRCLDDEQ